MSEQDDPTKSRSVNHFDSRGGLKLALNHKETKSVYVDVGRDFPRALIGSSLGVPRDDDAMSECSTVFEPDSELDWMLINFNQEISQPQTLDEELNRLQVLKSYLILDSEREASFERLTGLAARVFKVPIALVSLVDLGRQWFMSNRGLGDVRETPRKLAFCAHAIISKEDLLIVPDATIDPRFCDNALVTGPPNIRFYAGAPLLCPEGYKLGTLCLIDTKTRPDGLDLDDKQSLREMASLVIDAMVERRREKLRVLQDKSQIIATTAHDLLTPLSGVQMSLSLLLEDERLKGQLTNGQADLIETAAACGDIMHRICHHAIETFRGDVDKHNNPGEKPSVGQSGPKAIVVSEMVKNLNMVMEPYPKKVPLFISVDPLVPLEFVSDDLKVFRSCVNFLTNALKKVEKGNVHLKIYVAGKKKKPKLVFECEDTGPGIPLKNYAYLFRPFREVSEEDDCIRLRSDGFVAAGVCAAPMNNSGLGLYSVANQITSIGGEYGFRPREANCAPGNYPTKITGAIFWFSIPLVVPDRLLDESDATMRHQNGTTDGPKYFDAGANRTADTTAEISSQKLVRVLSTKNLSAADSAEIYKTVNEVLAVEHKREASIKKLDVGGVRIRRALVIDDSIVIRKSVGRGLSKLGFDVTYAVNGLEGLKQMQQQVFDVVLCDFLMPVMDGLDCVQQYRDWEEPHRPWFRQYIVGISAHASANDTEKGKQAGMNDFKAKPITMSYLKELGTSQPLVDTTKTLDDLLKTDTDAYAMEVDKSLQDKFKSVQCEVQEHTAPEVPTCLVVEPRSNTVMKDAVERLGWNAVHVSDGEDGLRLLKMRNWDAVFIENEVSRLAGIGCVARFRQWEDENRVALQNNVFLLTPDFAPSPTDQSVSASYPMGFNGALGKPVLMKDLRALLRFAEEGISTSASSKNIVSR
jgi:CheY-like chemotaxis protein/signal transduction histidine kinase